MAQGFVLETGLKKKIIVTMALVSVNTVCKRKTWGKCVYPKN